MILRNKKKKNLFEIPWLLIKVSKLYSEPPYLEVEETETFLEL